MADKEADEQTIADEANVVKYRLAAEIANKALAEVIKKCKAKESSIGLCQFGDNFILEETGKIYKKDKDIKKGIAFPTCISVNNCICHFSPLKTDTDYVLKDGDMVKIDLGAHIDGFIAVVAHTIVIGASKENKVKGKMADVIKAAYYAAEAAFKLVKPGNENNAVTDSIQKIAETFKCKPIEGMLSHQLKQFKIDGEKTIIQNPSDAQKKDHEKCEFEVFEVYAIDVLVSTGEGKGREMDTKTTVFKKTEEVYQLKMKASRAFFSEMEKRFATMPFTLRAFDDIKKAKMGILECTNHKLVEPYHVLYEKEGEFVAQFKFTVLLNASGQQKITGHPFDIDAYESVHSISDDDLKQLLSLSISKKSTKKKKKQAEKDMANHLSEMAKVERDGTNNSVQNDKVSVSENAASPKTE